MVRNRLAAALAILVFTPLWAEVPAPRQAIAAEVMEFGDWSVACDNARECTAVSISRAYVERISNADPGDYASPKLWVKRSPEQTAKPRVFVDTATWGEVNPLGPLTLHIYQECDGDCTGRGYKISQIEPGRYELMPQQVDKFFHDSTRTSRAATRRSTGEMHGIITTSGLTAAMRYIDEVQGRGDTATAIFAKGNKSASAIPAPPVREPVRIVRGVNEPSVEMPGHAEMQRIRSAHCKGPHGPNEINIQRFRLTNGQALWSIICEQAEHNATHLWLVETRTDQFELFKLPRREQEREAQMPILPHSLFDPASGQLTSYYAGKEGRSCGWKRRWAWTGSAFVMIDAIEMPACLDLRINQWLQTYRAVPE